MNSNNLCNTHYNKNLNFLRKLNIVIHTRGGKQSSAALRGTENPPWVLVSEAVSVLQNM